MFSRAGGQMGGQVRPSDRRDLMERRRPKGNWTFSSRADYYYIYIHIQEPRHFHFSRQNITAIGEERSREESEWTERIKRGVVKKEGDKRRVRVKNKRECCALYLYVHIIYIYVCVVLASVKQKSESNASRTLPPFFFFFSSSVLPHLFLFCFYFFSFNIPSLSLSSLALSSL